MAGEVTLPEITDVGEAPPPPAPEGVHALSTAPGMVAVAHPDGNVTSVRVEDAEDAFAQGMRPATQVEITRATQGIGLQAASAVIGVGRGALPFMDPLLIEGSRALGGNAEAEDTRRALNLSHEVNPGLEIGGEIAGSLAGAFLLPGGGAAKAATGEGMLARGLSRFAAAAPRAALEGAAFAVNHQASEDALGNHAAVGEKYVSSALGGAVFGGLLGGGLHALGGAVADKAATFYGRTAEAAEGLATREAGASLKPAEERSGVVDWLRNKATETAEEQSFKATGAKIRDIQKLGATAEAQTDKMRRIGRTMLDEGIVDGTASQATIAKRLTEKVRAVGEDLSAMRAKLDTAVERPSMPAILKGFEERVLKPLSELPLGEAEGRPAAEFMASMIEKGGERPDFATLYKYRRRLDDLLERGGEYSRIPGGPSKPGAEPLRALRGIVEEEFENAGERAAKELGDTFGDKYRLAKQTYGDLKTVEKIATKEVARGGANRAISLTDTIAAGAGLAFGGVGGVAAGIGNKLVRTYGNQAAADVLNRVSRLQVLQRAAEGVDKAVTSGVRGFLTGERSKAVASTAPKVTDETVRAIREATRDPSAVTARVGEVLGGQGLGEAAPRTSQAMASTLMRAAVYLRDKAPKEPPPSGIAFVPQPPRPISHSELATYAEIVHAVNDPVSVIDDLQHGRVSREQVAALKDVYPELYQHVRAELAAQAVQLRPTLSTQQEIALSVLFDVPVGELMKADTVLSFMAVFKKDAASQPSDGSPPPGQPRQFDRERGSLASGFDRQERDA